MLYVAAVLLITGALLFTLYVREQDLPVVEAVSPYAYLEDRKAQIYENLRDLQFEFRVGKLSDADYQKTKLELQSELAKTMAEIDRHKGVKPEPKPAAATTATATAKAPTSSEAQTYVCPHCNAKFDRALKFCGECGKSMSGEAA